MQPIIMQDWTTIRGAASTTVIQSQADWILTAPFQDISFYLDVREFGVAGITLAYETCPGRDDVLFRAMTPALTIAGTSVVVTNIFASVAANTPVSHWTRWKLTGPASTWDVTFRIMAAGNVIG
jgi:hypothetical protein